MKNLSSVLLNNSCPIPHVYENNHVVIENATKADNPNDFENLSDYLISIQNGDVLILTARQA